MDCLSKEQLLLLQHNLTYEVYEKFMSLFDQDEMIPEDTKSRNEYILEEMKIHPFWGEIKGWGSKRVYKNISMIEVSEVNLMFNGTTKKELIAFLDQNSSRGLCRYEK